MDKNYTIEHKEMDEFLEFRLRGEKTLNCAITYWQEITNISKELGYKKILVDSDLKKGLTMTEIYTIFSTLQNLDIYSKKIAYVERNPLNLENSLFGELVATNRGIKNKVFQEYSKAQQWLLNKDKLPFNINSRKDF